MLRNPWTAGSLILILGVALVALLAPWLSPHDPHHRALVDQFKPPSFQHLLGTDHNGGDILSRLIHGARLSLRIAFLVVLLSGGLGVLVGLVSGYYGGLLDVVIMRLVDVLLAFPGLLLAIALVAVLGPDPDNLVLALSALGWVPFTRLVRGQVLAAREREYVLAAQTLGLSSPRILFFHLLPNILSPVVVQATFALAGVILAESSLSFLGLGVPPGTPSWGAMLNEGKAYLLDAPHLSLIPGATIMLVILAFNLVGDGLRDWLDPRAARR